MRISSLPHKNCIVVSNIRYDRQLVLQFQHMERTP